VTNDTTLDGDHIITIYQKQGKVEEYYSSLKQHASLAKSPTRTEITQYNYFVAALWSFVKIELLKVQTNKNSNYSGKMSQKSEKNVTKDSMQERQNDTQ